MRTLGVCASILASAQLLILPARAFAQEPTPSSAAPSPAPADAPPPADTSPAPAPAEKAAPPPAAAAGTALVHIDSPREVSLERRDGAAWAHVCVSPCDAQLSTSDEYRLMGTDLNESKPFMLDASKGNKITLDVRPGYHNRAQTGVYIAIASGVLFVAGVATILIGSDGKTPFNADGETHLGNTNAIFAGSALILAGVCGGIFGGAWILDNAHTRVGGDIIKNNQAPASDKNPSGPVETKFQYSTSKREPTWNTPKTAGIPAEVNVPLLRRTF